VLDLGVTLVLALVTLVALLFRRRPLLELTLETFVLLLKTPKVDILLLKLLARTLSFLHRLLCPLFSVK